MDKDKELQIVESFAGQLSLNRVKTEGLQFDRDYKRSATTGRMELVSEKAVVITQGKTTKVAFGEGQKYATYEEAVEATREHWREYFKKRRQMARTDATRARDRQRQQRHRAEKRAQNVDILRRQ